MDSWLAAINKANRREVVRKHSRINLAFKKNLTIKIYIYIYSLLFRMTKQAETKASEWVNVLHVFQIPCMKLNEK